MEHEAIVKEHASLENQLASVRMQINGLTSEVEEQKNKVSMDIWRLKSVVESDCNIRFCCRLLSHGLIMIRHNLN